MDITSNNNCDNTIISTPKPTATSTEIKRKFETDNKIVNHDFSESLGILSVNSISMDNDNSLASVDEDFRRQCLLANASLDRSRRLSSLPSRYLKPTSVTNNNTEKIYMSESTVNESDLISEGSFQIGKSDSSTPRQSDTNNVRESLGKTMSDLSTKLNNKKVTIDEFMKEFQMRMDSTSNTFRTESFKTGEKAEEQLLIDELSWKNEKGIPGVSISSISSDNIGEEISIGSFFKKKSEKLSNIIDGNNYPSTIKEPIPLIDSFSVNEIENNLISDESSLSISSIAKMLSDTSKTPGRCANYFLNPSQENRPLEKFSYNSKNKLNKENIKPSTRDKSSIPSPTATAITTMTTAAINDNKSLSSRSSSSLSNLPEGKLPIESTKSEIVWGCVKVGKSLSQDFILRNRSSSRLKIQAKISGQAFKIERDRLESDTLSIVKFTLHPYESRCIAICFAPTQIGAAVDELNFTSVDHQHVQSKKQAIRLYGYGGYGNVELQQTTKDSTGRYWLSLGLIDNKEVVRKSFTVQNLGNLPSFGLITSVFKGVCAGFNINVEPRSFVLIPQEQKKIIVSYTPMKSDIKKIQMLSPSSSIIEMGVLQIISGTEVTRGRIRRLCEIAHAKGLKIDPIFDELKVKFPGELMPADIVKFHENTQSLKELQQYLTYKEIVVTLEEDPDHTLVAQFPDETSMFQTLCQDNSFATYTICNDRRCNVEPTNIILMPPAKIEDVMFLSSENSVDLYYRTMSIPEGLIISPSEGSIAAGETVVLKLKCRTSIKLQENIKVMIYLNNETLQIDVKIISISGKQKK